MAVWATPECLLPDPQNWNGEKPTAPVTYSVNKATLPHPSQTVLPPGDRPVFKDISLWEPFLFK